MHVDWSLFKRVSVGDWAALQLGPPPEPPIDPPPPPPLLVPPAVGGTGLSLTTSLLSPKASPYSGDMSLTKALEHIDGSSRGLNDLQRLQISIGQNEVYEEASDQVQDLDLRAKRGDPASHPPDPRAHLQCQAYSHNNWGLPGFNEGNAAVITARRRSTILSLCTSPQSSSATTSPRSRCAEGMHHISSMGPDEVPLAAPDLDDKVGQPLGESTLSQDRDDDEEASEYPSSHLIVQGGPRQLPEGTDTGDLSNAERGKSVAIHQTPLEMMMPFQLNGGYESLISPVSSNRSSNAINPSRDLIRSTEPVWDPPYEGGSESHQSTSKALCNSFVTRRGPIINPESAEGLLGLRDQTLRMPFELAGITATTRISQLVEGQWGGPTMGDDPLSCCNQSRPRQFVPSRVAPILSSPLVGSARRSWWDQVQQVQRRDMAPVGSAVMDGEKPSAQPPAPQQPSWARALLPSAALRLRFEFIFEDVLGVGTIWDRRTSGYICKQMFKM